MRTQPFEQERTIVARPDVREDGLEGRDELQLVDVLEEGQHDAGGVRGAVGVDDRDAPREGVGGGCRGERVHDTVT